MKRVIDGTTYNTKTATLVAFCKDTFLKRGFQQWETEISLYRTKKNNFFLVTVEWPMGVNPYVLDNPHPRNYGESDDHHSVGTVAGNLTFCTFQAMTYDEAYDLVSNDPDFEIRETGVFPAEELGKARRAAEGLPTRE
jgi:hypothetical protein